ncbi:LysR family transcriptional regulator [Clostridium botulinum]|uniref:LysR family transcriptional regulator n=1 Tax=Clostridium botulinum TaxID=1491 RepID=A0A846J8K9_CLOBO|nr:selenium metabolism-associated LysR family transcriptional regulator [Clostridium botulinum]ACA56955.1 transcriptional regulator, LysR family [Clostridium botulinum A3 str. Loch Maree]NFH66249.1 LysR family transcriptional regulator [Clostridium botulinum]NFJ10229.1 LysR family transcriptional regulator [Clostridium botulinum]NFK16409.1 LysR family transcriptional regulator [Clostridium botulinum]NFM94027.1 LysR family transcriptional regulator [Clostridium botulinum]
MDFKQIEAFISVAKYKSFSKAANSVFLSQPAISSHISTLEKELSVQLFDRTSKEVLLTPAGNSFLKYALEILNARDKAVCCLSNFNNTVCGKLTLTASSTPCNTIIPDLVKGFENKFPDVAFNVLEQSSGEVLDNLLNFNSEIGIIGDLISDDKIKTYKLVEDNLVLISNPNLNIPDEIDVESILKYKFVLRKKSSATRKTFENNLKKSGIDPSTLEVCCEVNNLDTIFQFVKTGVGVSVISEKVYNGYLGLNSIKKSKITNLNLKRSLYLAICSKRTLTPTAKAFFDFCLDYFDIHKSNQ